MQYPQQTFHHDERPRSLRACSLTACSVSASVVTSVSGYSRWYPYSGTSWLRGHNKNTVTNADLCLCAFIYKTRWQKANTKQDVSSRHDFLYLVKLPHHHRSPFTAYVNGMGSANELSKKRPVTVKSGLARKNLLNDARHWVCGTIELALSITHPSFLTHNMPKQSLTHREHESIWVLQTHTYKPPFWKIGISLSSSSLLVGPAAKHTSFMATRLHNFLLSRTTLTF